MNPPTIGRTVLYVMPQGHPSAGEVRPAVVTKVWTPACVNLHVHLDPYDAPLEPQQQSSVCLDEPIDTPQPRTWHWPPRA